jgi:hypothetical protein
MNRLSLHLGVPTSALDSYIISSSTFSPVVIEYTRSILPSTTLTATEISRTLRLSGTSLAARIVGPGTEYGSGETEGSPSSFFMHCSATMPAPNESQTPSRRRQSRRRLMARRRMMGSRQRVATRKSGTMGESSKEGENEVGCCGDTGGILDRSLRIEDSALG